MSGIEDGGDAVVLHAQRRSALAYPSILMAVGGPFAMIGVVGTSEIGDFAMRAALTTLVGFWGWAGLWYLYCRLLPGRVSYVAGYGVLEARRGTKIVRRIPVSEIIDVEWGLQTYDWSGMATAPFGATMPRLLVVVAGTSRWDSQRVQFPPICVWGEEPLDVFGSAVRRTLDVAPPQ